VIEGQNCLVAEEGLVLVVLRNICWFAMLMMMRSPLVCSEVYTICPLMLSYPLLSGSSSISCSIGLRKVWIKDTKSIYLRISFGPKVRHNLVEGSHDVDQCSNDSPKDRDPIARRR
jgi:hypothetical protein